MQQQITKHKHPIQKENLKVDNRKDVDRKRLEQRVLKKLGDDRLTRLCAQDDFIYFVYGIIERSGYYNTDEPNNSEVYIKKGRRQLACEILNDLSAKTPDGDIKVAQLRRLTVRDQLNISQLTEAEEGNSNAR